MRVRVLAWAVISGAVIPLVPACAADFHLVEQSTTKIDPVADTTHGPLKWSRGAFVYANYPSDASPPVFSVMDRAGKVQYTVSLRVPGASEYWFSDFARGIDGTIAFAGGTYSSRKQPMPLIALISPDGRTSAIVQTYPFYPYMISGAPDGTYWAIGMQMVDKDPRSPKIDPNGGVVRHFGRRGNPMGQFLPQAEYMNRHGDDRLDSGYLVVTHDRIAWYGPKWGGSGRSEYLEMPLTTMIPQSFPGMPDLPAGQTVNSFALTEDGTAVLSVQDYGPRVRTVYRLDRNQSRWIPLDVPVVGDDPQYTPALLGSDENRLVFRDGRDAAFLTISQ